VAEVSNLPGRATWTQDGKVFEGCYGLDMDLGLVVAYFQSDRTVVNLPQFLFERVTGT
jgi:hypothetical protein